MYAVIETGSKQYKVAIGDKLKVEKLSANVGDSIRLERVLMVANGEDVTLGTPTIDSAVDATVISHGKASKIKVFKMKRRKNYRRTQGHRQPFTEIEITAIGGKKAKATEDKKSAKKKAKGTTSAGAKKTRSKGADGVGDDLTQINGIGPVIEKKLSKLGITTFKQIADLDQAETDRINETLSFKGRIEREQWIDQAKKLLA